MREVAGFIADKFLKKNNTSAMIVKGAILCSLAAASATATHEWTTHFAVSDGTPTSCVAPGRCTPPETLYSRVAPVHVSAKKHKCAIAHLCCGHTRLADCAVAPAGPSSDTCVVAVWCLLFSFIAATTAVEYGGRLLRITLHPNGCTGTRSALHPFTPAVGSMNTNEPDKHCRD
jgi:hypothetical protein